MPLVYVAKDWSEANQLRDPRGKFAGTRGGSGGGTAGGAGADIEQEIVANRKYDPNAWYADEANAPWNRPKEDFERGEVPGFKIGAGRQSTQDGGAGDVLGGNDGSGYITLTPAYFNAYGGAQGRKLLIEHEVGHDIQRALSKQGREEALLKPWNSNGKTGSDARYDLPWLGSSNKPGHEALAWSYNELWDGFVGSGEKQALLSEIAATAKRMNTPVPVEWGGVAKTFVSKAWSEATQQRDPKGRFAGTTGAGTGGGGAAAGAAILELPNAKIDFPDVPAETLAPMREELARLGAKYPEVAEHITYVGSGRWDGGMGMGRTTTNADEQIRKGKIGSKVSPGDIQVLGSNIVLNPAYLSEKPITALGGDFIGGATPRTTITHEFGHVVDARLSQTGVGLPGERLQQPKLTGVSKYATHTTREAFPEAFTAHELGINTSHPDVKAAVAYMSAGGLRPNVTKAFTYIGKEWSEAIQLRDPKGRFAGTIGGGGGGGGSAGAGAEENPYVAGQQLGAMDQIPEGQWNDRVGDPRLADVMREQGYFSPGNVYTKEQMDGFVKAGEIEILRGTSKEKYATDIIDSKGSHPYTGTGVHGNGLYAAGVGKSERIQADYNMEAKRLGPGHREQAANFALKDTGVFTAIDYAWPDGQHTGKFQGGIVRMTLRPEAKLVKKFDLLGQVGNPDTIKEFDLGRIAALKGYDAIIVPRSFGPDHYVVLNRSSLRIQNTPWTLGDYISDYKE